MVELDPPIITTTNDGTRTTITHIDPESSDCVSGKIHYKETDTKNVEWDIAGQCRGGRGCSGDNLDPHSQRFKEIIEKIGELRA